MAITNFIPQVWSARLQENLQKELIFGALCNRNYEGDIAQWGDTVHINTLNDITVKPYDPSVEISDPEQLSGTDVALTIDHGAYYNFFVNDVDAVQARSDLMEAAMRNAAYRLAADAERYIISTITEGAGSTFDLDVSALEAGTMYTLLLQMKGDMDQAGVPRRDRKLILPATMESALLMDERFVSSTAAAGDSLPEGAVARAAGFDIYVSHDLENKLVTMIPDAVTFANQITKVDAYRPEKGFCDGVKGLCLSGAKVTMPDAVFIYNLSA